MRNFLLSLLASIGTYNFISPLPDYISHEDSRKLLHLSKQIIAHPGLNAELIFNELEEIASSPEVVTENDLLELGIQVDSNKLEQFNSKFFESFKKLVQEKLPAIQEKLKKSDDLKL